MKPLITRAIVALTLAAALTTACNSPSDWASDPPPTFNIVQATLFSNGQQYAPQGEGVPDGGALPAVSLQVELLVVATAPTGQWTISITADGALAVTLGDAGTYTMSFASEGTNTPVTLQIPVTVTQPAGNGFIHLILGTTRADYAFEISAVTPAVALCTQTISGACLSGSIAIDDNGGGTESDGGIVVSENGTLETITLEGASAGQLHEGDRFFIQISLPDGGGPRTPGVTWVGKVTTAGTFALTSDGGTTSSTAIEFTEGTLSVALPAVVTAVGIGTIAASVGLGAPTILSRVAVSSTQSIHEVRLIDYVGLGADNLVSVCSTRVAGTIRVQPAIDAGVVVPSVATLAVTPGGNCPAGYPSHADFVWTGYDPYALLTVTDELSANTIINVVPTLGTTTTAQIIQPVSASWVCEPADASADSGSGAAGNSCSGGATVFVSLQVFRGAPAGDASISTTPCVRSVIGVQAPVNIQVTGGPTITDVDGKATLQLIVPPSVVQFPIVISVDGKVTQMLTVQ